MELYLFKTENLDSQLIDISNLLYMLELATIGLETEGLFSKIDAEGFIALASTARRKLQYIENSMQTVCLGLEDDKNYILIEAE